MLDRASFAHLTTTGDLQWRDLILRLRVDPETGKREIVVDYTSDSDALPIEHEEEHRQLANKVIEGGLQRAARSPSAASRGGGGWRRQAAEQPVAQPDRHQAALMALGFRDSERAASSC